MSGISFSPVDSNSPVPLYYQVESDLRRLIESGLLAPGDAVPPEMDLCRSYNVSRQTMRTALSRLAAEELIARSPGRGTFVVPRSHRTRFYLDRSFTQQMAELGLSARSRVLLASEDRINDDDPLPLQPYLGASCFRLVRVRYGDDKPVGIQHTSILSDSCPDIGRIDFESNSLYDILARKFELVIREIRHVVSAAAAGPDEAVLLDVADGAPLLVVHTTALLKDEEIIEYTRSLYRADRYEYGTRHIL